MTKQRLDQLLVAQKFATTRSQAENLIRLGKVNVNERPVNRPGTFVDSAAVITLKDNERYVSRAGLKLASVAQQLGLSFDGKIVLDVGSSTGGFTDYALQHGARKVIAVDVGTEQLHPSLRKNRRIELYEKTDIRDVYLLGSGPVVRPAPSSEKSKIYSEAGAAPPNATRAADVSSDEMANTSIIVASDPPDIIVMDVSFISLRDILPHIAKLSGTHTQIVAMLKPQFEAGRAQVNKGVIKNDSIRRQILKDFEIWTKEFFIINGKRDSDVAGAKGNRERFYLLAKSTK